MRAYYSGMDPDEIERIECCRYGTAESVGNALKDFIEAGASTLVLRFASDNQPEQIERCNAHLLSVLKAVHAPA